MLIIVTVAVPVFNLRAVKASDDQPWSQLSNMLTARGGLGTAVVNGKIYAIGGLNGDLPLNVNEQFDPVLNKWTTKAPMPTPRSGFAIAMYNNKIYVIGGSVGNAYVGNNEVYDPSTNSWETKTSMPTPRSEFSASVVNDKIYLIGGKRYSSINPYFNETAVNQVYDPENDTWTTVAALPEPVYGYASAVIDGKIHIIGGSKNPSSGDTTVFDNAHQVFDPQTGTWNLAANIPTPTTNGGAIATQNLMAPSSLYDIGGFFSNTYSGETQIYNPNNNSWTTGIPMPTHRAYLSVAIINDLIYAIGGFDGTNWLNTVEVYKPVGYGTIPPQIQILSPENKTYRDVNVSYNLNRNAQWIGYGIDKKANVTLKGNIDLQNLTQGSHTIIIYANDSSGNMGRSKTIFFSIDNIPPEIVIILPLNQTYGSSDIQFTFSLNEPAKELAYSLDNNTLTPVIGNVSLPALTNGSHRLTIYATDEVGNSDSKTIYFSISTFPIIGVIAAIAVAIIISATGYLFYHRKKTGFQEEKVVSVEPITKESAKT